LLSRLAKMVVGLVMAASPPTRFVGLSLKAPTRTKLPAKELPEAEPSALLERKAVLWSVSPGKLMIKESADAFCGKRHGKRTSKKRLKEERPSLGQIDEVHGRLHSRKLWWLKKRIKE